MEILGSILVVLGALVFLAAGIGLWRLRDPYQRISAVATAAGAGIVFVVIGALLSDPSLDSTVKVILAVVLQLITSAIGGMVIARSAMLSGHRFAATELHIPHADPPSGTAEDEEGRFGHT